MTQSNRALARLAVIRALERAPQTLGQLLEACHSLFPDELIALLDDMVQTGSVERVDGMYTLASAVTNRWRRVTTDWQENMDRAYSALSAIMTAIHLPHCLDYEWWFTHASRELLAELLIKQNLLPVPQAIAFLGSPLFGAFVSVLVPDSRVYIIDKSAASLDAIRPSVDASRVTLVHYDASNPLPNDLIGVADMAFIDPPWYVDYYDLFFRRTVQLTAGRHATIGAVLFPLLTRPLSLAERKQTLEMAMGYGLSLSRVESQVAQYLTPHFEQESLRQKGIDAKNWRRGDLALFISDGTRLPENIGSIVEEGRWVEALFGKVKVKVRVKDENPDVYIAPELLPISEHSDILPSVSRRDPIRLHIDLWTSTQRAYRVRGWKVVWQVVQGVAGGLSQEDIVSNVQGVFPEATLPDTLLADVETTLAFVRHILQDV